MWLPIRGAPLPPALLFLPLRLVRAGCPRCQLDAITTGASTRSFRVDLTRTDRLPSFWDLALLRGGSGGVEWLRPPALRPLVFFLFFLMIRNWHAQLRHQRVGGCDGANHTFPLQTEDSRHPEQRRPQPPVAP